MRGTTKRFIFLVSWFVFGLLWNTTPLCAQSSDSAPVILTQPLDTIGYFNSNAVLSVQAVGSEPMFYQWRLNGAAIDDATNATLELATLTFREEGNYDVILSNRFGVLVSSNAFLNVVDMAEAVNATNLTWVTAGDVGWQIETNVTHDGYFAARSANIVNGQQSILQTTVTGPGTLVFWWNMEGNYGFYDNTLSFLVDGVKQAWLTNVSPWQAVTYYLADGTHLLQWVYVQPENSPVQNAGYVDQVSFTAGPTPPQISQSSASQGVPVGANVTLAATVFGTPPLAYQWHWNGMSLDGATNSTLALTNIQFAMEGNYWLTVSNAYGITNTAAAFLNVLDIAEALNTVDFSWSAGGNLSWFPQSTHTHDGVAALQTGGIGADQQTTLQTTFTGPGTLSFWWAVSSETKFDFLNFTINGIEQARISGSVDWEQKHYSLTQGVYALAWTYSKSRMFNWGFDAGWLDEVSYVPGTTGPSITSGPADQVVPLNSNAVFSVVAHGTPPIRYQWHFNDIPLPGETNSSLTLTNVHPSHIGIYSVSVSNDYGSSSAKARLNLPSIYAWGAGKTITYDNPDRGQSIVPTNWTDVTAVAGGAYHSLALRSNGSVVAWGFGYSQTNVPPELTNACAISAGRYHNVALRSNGTALAWGYSSYNLNQVPAAATNLTAVAAGKYHILALTSNGTVLAWGGESSFGQHRVPTNLTDVTAIAAGENHSLALRSNGTVVAWRLNAYGQTNVPPGLSNVVAIAAGASHNLALRNDGTLVAWGANDYGQASVPAGLSNVVAIAAGDAHSLALRSDGSLAAWGLNNYSQATIPAGLTNVIAIAAGYYHNLALVNDGTVTFLSRPSVQSTFGGSGATISVPCLGAAPLYYQWLKEGAPISEATNATISITNALFSDAGSYQVAISNIFGVATSAVVQLVVNDTAPYFTTHPADAAVVQNGNTVLTATPGGLPPFTYQWLFNGSPVAGATNAFLTVSNAQLADEGFYSLMASNALGVAISSNAYLNVIDVPDALGLTNVVWYNPYQLAWSAQTTNTRDGFAAVAGPMVYGSKAGLQTTVTGPGTLTFSWKALSPEVSFTFQIDEATILSERLYNYWRVKSSGAPKVAADRGGPGAPAERGRF